MKLTLKWRIVFSFAILLLLSVAIFISVFNFGLNSLFKDYATLQQERKFQQVVTQINALYLPETDSFNTYGLEAIGNAALQNGMILHVQTVNKELDWDISTHRAEECQLMLQHREKNIHSRYPNFNGSYTQTVFDLTQQGRVVGTVTIGYYGPYTFDDVELELINSLNQLMVGIGVVLLLMAAFLGSYLAVHLTRPIRKVVSTAKQITKGDYGTQIDEHYKTKEIAELVSTINVMSKQLMTKEIQKKRLTADVAHELRTPLSNLQSHMEAVIDEVWEPTPELFQGCCDEIKRLTNIVNQLRKLTEYEDHRAILTKQPFKVNDFFGTLLNSFAFAARDKNIILKSDTQPTAALCVADEEKIKQCMINLISNAIQYTPTGGTITLYYYENNGFSCFEISDTGIGIPNDDLPQIFERFYRVDPSRNQRTGGMGIGLSITKAIVEMHDGILSVHSTIGKGTTFTFKLPQ